MTTIGQPASLDTGPAIAAKEAALRPVVGIEATSGVGFKPQHAAAIDTETAFQGWFEVHAENYFVDGGPRLRQLEALRRNHALSLHGVGLSLAGADPLDRDHLNALRRLVDRFEPVLVSEHLAWTMHGGRYLADLLPVPLDSANLSRLADGVDATQEVLGRSILIENPARYMILPQDQMPEIAFLSELAQRTGCGLLLDINNVFVSARNLDFDPATFLDAVPADLVGEIHLAGHIVDARDTTLLIDNHGTPVADPVWALYERTVARIGPRATLIERDNEIPPWSALRAEAEQAQMILDAVARSPSPSR